MSLVNQNYEAGDQVKYNGREGVVVSNNYASRTITIEINGERITVNRSALDDIFGNKQKKSDDTLDTIILNEENYIEKLEGKLLAAKKAQKDYQKIMDENKVFLFKYLDIKDPSEISNTYERNEYIERKTAYDDAYTARRRAGNDIYSNAMTLTGEYLSLGKLKVQSIFNNRQSV